MAFRIIRNDITKVKADAIVNTANPKVAIGGGVDYAIYEAAGKDALLNARASIGKLDVGEIGVTPAFGLNAKYIIHVSGPYWIDGLHDEETLLRKCYDYALGAAYERGCNSIALPLLSTGTYGFSKEIGLRIALEAFNSFLLHHDMEIILVVFGETAYRLSGQIFDDVRAYIDSIYVAEKLQEEYRCGDFEIPQFFKREPEIESKSLSIRTECDELEYDISTFFSFEETTTFGEYLQQLINKKGMKNSEVYTAANLTKQYFSKLLNGKVTPSKTKILSLAIALKLNMDETIDFMKMSGYAFSPFSEVDKVFEYFICKGIYDIYKIDIVLFDCGLPTLVND